MEAAREAVVGGVVGALLILLVIVKLTIFKRGSNLPPARTGWIPWIGVAVPFGKEPLYYIEKTRREVSGCLRNFPSNTATRMLCRS